MNRHGNRNVRGTDDEQLENPFGEDDDSSSNYQSGRRPMRNQRKHNKRWESLSLERFIDWLLRLRRLRLRQILRFDKDKNPHDVSLPMLAHKSFPIYSMDVKTRPFHMVSLKEEVYVAPAVRVGDPDHPEKVYLLREYFVWIKAAQEPASMNCQTS
ncbi:hypothetical protein Tco_0818503 [Tanacetum coccineum]